MRVLGIDPGFDRLGLSILEGDPSKPIVVWSTCVLPHAGTQSYRLGQVYTAVANLITEYKPEKIAVETLFFSTNKKTALGVAEARGTILAVAGVHNVPVQEFSPAQVKLAVTGYGNADKAAIARMIPHLVQLDGRKRLDDELDAIAVGIAGLAQRSITAFA